VLTGEGETELLADKSVSVATLISYKLGRPTAGCRQRPVRQVLGVCFARVEQPVSEGNNCTFSPLYAFVAWTETSLPVPVYR
jgi:hypothetical protein